MEGSKIAGMVDNMLRDIKDKLGSSSEDDRFQAEITIRSPSGFRTVIGNYSTLVFGHVFISIVADVSDFHDISKGDLVYIPNDVITLIRVHSTSSTEQ